MDNQIIVDISKVTLEQWKQKLESIMDLKNKSDAVIKAQMQNLEDIAFLIDAYQKKIESFG